MKTIGTLLAILALAGLSACTSMPSAKMVVLEKCPPGKVCTLNTDSGMENPLVGGPINRATLLMETQADGSTVIQPIVDGSAMGTGQTTLPAVVGAAGAVASTATAGHYGLRIAKNGSGNGTYIFNDGSANSLANTDTNVGVKVHSQGGQGGNAAANAANLTKVGIEQKFIPKVILN